MKKIVCWITIAVISLCYVLPLPASAANHGQVWDSDDALAIINDIIDWKKQSIGTANIGYLFDEKFLEFAGTTYTDWYAVGLGRLGYVDDYEAFLEAEQKYVTDKYKSESRLDASKATEWHRISIAVLALGGDPTDFGTNPDGSAINLIKDGVYGRNDDSSPGIQGTNGWIWGLIALDSLRYQVPAGANFTRGFIIEKILAAQLADGGFSLDGDYSDIDITAMALQALAPYYNSEQVYDYTSMDGTDKSGTVRQAVDIALGYLSESQTADGDYISWDAQNVESTAQVLVALCALGIDPGDDDRFSKEGKTVFDGIMKYRMDDGGFTHSFEIDEDHPAPIGGIASETMASEQVLYAAVAYLRYSNGLRSLYDFRPEMDDELKVEIVSLNSEIEALPAVPSEADSAQVENLFVRYMEIPITEQSYVYKYHLLADSMAALGINNPSEYHEFYMGQNTGGNGSVLNVAKTLDITGRSADSGRTSGGSMVLLPLIVIMLAVVIVVVLLMNKKKKTKEDTDVQ